MNRIGVLVLVNLAALLLLSLALDRIGLADRVGGHTDLGNLFFFTALLVLFAGIVPAALSKWVTKKAMWSRVVGVPGNASEAWLMTAVQRHAGRVGIKTPEVAVYDSPAVRAYAAGLNKDAALIAVSTGLLQHENRREAEALLERKFNRVARGDVLIPLFFGLLLCWMIARVVHGL